MAVPPEPGSQGGRTGMQTKRIVGSVAAAWYATSACTAAEFDLGYGWRSAERGRTAGSRESFDDMETSLVLELSRQQHGTGGDRGGGSPESGAALNWQGQWPRIQLPGEELAFGVVLEPPFGRGQRAGKTYPP
eukprot:7304207-Pyramimonas_sp.AAC.1